MQLGNENSIFSLVNAQIAQSGPKSMICDIEGISII